jgi:3-hydroxyacyl-[acyl-carrier-protein] dehydratase
MELLNSLFTISTFIQTEDLIEAKIELDPKHEIFKGHFPGFPVMPAVVQLQIVNELINKSLCRKVRIVSILHSKFLKIINPEETKHLTIQITLMEGADIKATGFSSEDFYFKFRAIIKDVN